MFVYFKIIVEGLDRSHLSINSLAMSRQNDKAQHERLQIIIAELLKDEENKYCADCDAKGIAMSY